LFIELCQTLLVVIGEGREEPQAVNQVAKVMCEYKLVKARGSGTKVGSGHIADELGDEPSTFVQPLEMDLL